MLNNDVTATIPIELRHLHHAIMGGEHRGANSCPEINARVMTFEFTIIGAPYTEWTGDFCGFEWHLEGSSERRVVDSNRLRPCNLLSLFGNLRFDIFWGPYHVRIN